jgi:hypothetical protein
LKGFHKGCEFQRAGTMAALCISVLPVSTLVPHIEPKHWLNKWSHCSLYS